MLGTFQILKNRYASSEVGMEELAAIGAYDFIRFENRGISRAKLECLLCEVCCAPLETLREQLSGKRFDSVEMFRRVVETSGAGLREADSDDPGLVVFTGDTAEVTGVIDEAGRVSVDEDDVDFTESFQVFLRVQGF